MVSDELMSERTHYPAYFTTDEEWPTEDGTESPYYEVEGPNGPVSYRTPSSGPHETTMEDLAMGAGATKVDKAETPWADRDTENPSREKIRPRSETPDNTYEVFAIPMSTLVEYEFRHALTEDFQHHDVIHYQPLRKLPDGAWLISVRGRVYELSEETLEAGIDALSDMMESRRQERVHE